MVTIEERKSKKAVGQFSLWVTFPYRADFVEIMKQTREALFDKKAVCWECPVTNLSFLINEFTRRAEPVSVALIDHPDIQEKEPTLLVDYKIKPFEHQKEAIKFGLTHSSWLLLDAPGLGKTAAVLHLAEELKARGEIEHCLVICGVNSLKMNWVKEVNFHTNETVRVLGQRTRRSGEPYIGSTQDRLDDLKNPIEEFFVITNIETLRNADIVKAIMDKKAKNHFGMIIADEVHCMKNPHSQQGSNFLKLNASYKVGLTGTLLLNSPFDAFVGLKWIGLENCAFSTFKFYYGIFGGVFHNELKGYKNLDFLKSVLEKNCLRRTKDSLDLPPKNIITEVVEMDSGQQKFYDNLVEGEVLNVDKVSISTANLLGMLTRLRQATSCPSVLTSDKINSAKIDRALDLMEQFLSQGEKIVVFSEFKGPLNELASRIRTELKINPLICTGDVSESGISANIDTFQNNPNYPILLATSKKLGTGVTLTAASTMIFIDTPWTQAVFDQCCDRIHRISQDRPVFIYKLITKGTVDEKVDEILASKKAIADFVVDDNIENEHMRDILLRMLSVG